jgi:hypothetical protein
VTSVLAQIDDNLALRVPQFFCCNCGEVEDLRPLVTPLNVAHILNPGSRFALKLDLPYCKRCANSAARRPVGLIKKTLIATLLSVCAGVIAMITPLTSVVGVWAFYLIAVPVFALVFGCYALQKARGKQTSYHQPVHLVQVKRQSSGQVSAITLCFTHARYARAFAGANTEEISRGVLVVEVG